MALWRSCLLLHHLINQPLSKQSQIGEVDQDVRSPEFCWEEKTNETYLNFHDDKSQPSKFLSYPPKLTGRHGKSTI